MAGEYTVVYKAVADFAQLNREADKAKRSLKELERQNDTLGESGTRNQTKMEKFGSTFAKISGYAKQLEKENTALAKAQEKLASVGNSSAAAQERHAKAQAALTALQRDSTSSAEDVAKATRKVAQEALSVTSSLRTLSSAHKEYQKTQAQTNNGSTGLLASVARQARAWEAFPNAIGKAVAALAGMSPMILTIAAAGPPAIAAIAGLGGAAVALAGVLAPLAGVLATVPQFFSLIGQSAGALMVAFHGVGAALKAQTALAETSGTALRANAEQQRTAALAVRDAYRGIRDARENMAKTFESSSVQMVQAERAVRDAQEARTLAQRTLTYAIRDSTRALEDMENQAQHASLSEREATLRLAEARANLLKVNNSSTADQAQRTAAQQAVDEAQNALAGLNVSQKRNAEDLALAERKGVQGSDAVKAAKIGVRDANEAVVTSERGLRDTIRDTAIANRNVIEAQGKAMEALTAALFAQKTAAQSLGAAYADAMAKLPASAQAFVRVLGTLRPQLKAMREEAANGLFPGLTASIGNFTKLLPSLGRIFGETGKAFGDLALKFSQKITTPEWIAFLNKLGDSNVRIINSLGDGVIHLAGAFKGVMTAAMPLAEALSKSFGRVAAAFDAWANSAKGQRQMTNFFERTRIALHLWWVLLKNIGSIFASIFKVSFSAGAGMMQDMIAATQRWAEYLKTAAGQNHLKKIFDEAKTVAEELFSLVGKIIGGISKIAAFGTDQLIGKKTPAQTKLESDRATYDSLKGSGAPQPILDALHQNIATDKATVAAQGGPRSGGFLDALSGSGIGDAFTKLIKTISDNGPAITAILGNLGVVLGNLVAAGGGQGLTLFIGGLQLLTGALAALTATTLGKDTIGFLLGLAVAIKAIAIASRITGISTILATAPGRKLKNAVLGKIGLGAAESTGAAAIDTSAATLATAGDSAAAALIAGANEAAAALASGGAAAGTKQAAGGVAGGAIGGGEALAGGAAGAGIGAGGVGATLAGGGEAATGVAASAGATGLGLGAAGVAGALALIAAGFVTAYKASKGFRDTVKATIDFIKEKLKGLAPVWDDIVSTAKSAWTIITQLAKLAVITLVAIFAPIVGSIALVFVTLRETIAGLIKGIVVIIVGEFRGIFEVLAGVFKLIADLLTGKWSAIGGDLEKIGKGFIDIITSPFKGAFELLKGIVKDAVRNIGDLWSGIKSFFSDPIDFVLNILQTGIIDPVNAIASAIGLGKILPDVKGGGKKSGPKDITGNNGAGAGSSGPARRGNSPVPMATGGVVPGHGNTDSVPAMLTPGEYVIKKDSAAKIGMQNLHNLNRLATGGRPRKKDRGFLGTGIGPSLDSIGDGIGTVIDKSGNLLSGAFDGVTSLIGDAAKMAEYVARKGAKAALTGLLAPARIAVGTLGNKGIGGMINHTTTTLMDKLVDFIGGKDGGKGSGKTAASGGRKTAPGGVYTSGTYHSSPSVDRWEPEMLSALSHFGLDASFLPGLKNLIYFESGGNPDSINLWDSNAKAGIPSQGLMQTIPPTFEAYRSKDLPDNIRDPAANIYAGLNYALKNYGPAMIKAGGRHKADGTYLGYAQGGLVGGQLMSGDNPSIPAMLTPGEYVVDAQTADKLGTAALDKLNRGAGHLMKMGGRIHAALGGSFRPTALGGTANYSSGASRGGAPDSYPLSVGSSGPRVVTLEHLLGYRPHGSAVSGKFGTTLQGVLKAWQAGMGLDQTGHVDNQAVLDTIASTNGLRDPHPGSLLPIQIGSRGDIVSQIQGILGVPVTGVFNPLTQGALINAQTAAGLPPSGMMGAGDISFFQGAANSGFPLLAGTRINSDVVKQLQARFDLPQTGFFDNDLKQAIQGFESSNSGLDDNTGARVSPALLARLLSTTPELDSKVVDLGVAIANEREWQDDLLKLAGMGDGRLALYFADQGVNESLTLVRQAVQNPGQASVLNSQVIEQGTLEGTYGPIQANTSKITGNYIQDLINMASAIANSPTPPSIRSLSTALRSADYSIVQTYAQGRDRLKNVIDPGKFAILDDEVAKFQQGLFYAGGGKVPGQGNTDTVKAMLTPGEYVLKKSVAEMLGLPTLDALNAGSLGFMADGPVAAFANGGLVGPSVPQLRSTTTTTSSTKGDTVVTYEFNTEINNPVGENSSESLARMIQRKAALGVLSGPAS